jgi:hypothetical protein
VSDPFQHGCFAGREVGAFGVEKVWVERDGNRCRSVGQCCMFAWYLRQARARGRMQLEARSKHAFDTNEVGVGRGALAVEMRCKREQA